MDDQPTRALIAATKPGNGSAAETAGSAAFTTPVSELPPLAAEANDLKALRNAVVDAAGVGAGLWLSYLFVLLYLLIAAGGVRHEDLFFESPVKLPFLNIDLPLKGFFILGPPLFLIVHAYVLLHFGMLSSKVGTFDQALRDQIKNVEIRTRLRRQLPSNVFVQFLAGPTEVRDGRMGFLLWLIALISLVVGPVCLLVLLELQFLPYHSEAMTWWHRLSVLFDLLLIWLFWPSIAQLDQKPQQQGGARQRMLRAERVLTWSAMWVLTGGATLLLLVFATYPGEHLDNVLWQPKGFLPRSSRAVVPEEPSKSSWTRTWFIEQVRDGLDALAHTPGAVRQLLVEGEVDPASRTPASLWSNRLVLPGVSVVAHLNLDSQEKLAFLSETVSLRGRNLDGAVLIDAILPKADFTGASLRLAILDRADLRDAKLECARWVGNEGNGKALICAQLQGASLIGASLQGASLFLAKLQGARLFLAKLQGARLNLASLQDAWLYQASLQGASLDQASLQGADLRGASLQGASLDWASLQGASLDHAWLQGASLIGASLQGADLRGASLQGATLDHASLQGASLIEAPLQGAYLRGASLQGASLDRASLQGAWLDQAKLQGASLDGAFVWRADGSDANVTKTAIANLNPSRNFANCKHSAETNCPWTHEDFARWRADLADQVPTGANCEAMLQRIQSLDPKDPDTTDDDEAAIKRQWEHWQSQSASLEQAEGERVEQLRTAGCAADGPAVITALIVRMPDDNAPLFAPGSRNRATLAKAFLAPECKGARGLSLAQITKLQSFATDPPPPR